MNFNKEKIIEKLKAVREKSIIKKREVFSLNYIPESLLFRESQLAKLQELLCEAFRKSVNINCWGHPCTGKTISVRYVCQFLEDVWKELDIKSTTVIIPCSKYFTPSDILHLIIETLKTDLRKNGRLPFNLDMTIPKKGWDREMYLQIIRDLLMNFDSIVVIFDNFDQLIRKKYGDIIFLLSNLSKLSLVLISNQMIRNCGLDIEKSSALQLQELFFPLYTINEIEEMIKQRLILGLKEDTIIDSHVKKIVTEIQRNNLNILDALKFLKILVEFLDLAEKTKFDGNLLKEVYLKLCETNIIRKLNELPLNSQIICYIIAVCYETNGTSKNLKLNSNYILKKLNSFNQKYGNSFENVRLRTVQVYLNQLKLAGLIEYKRKSLGKGNGTRSVIKPRFNTRFVYDFFQKKGLWNKL